MSLYVGIDLGGTKIAGILWDSARQEALLSKTIGTQASAGPDAVLGRIANHIHDLCLSAHVDLAQVAGIGVGVPATFDAERGCTLLMPNLPGEWYEKPVVGILKKYLGRPITLINDARAFTLAEATLGAGQGYPSVVCFTLGTGIGGGIAIDGKLVLGLRGAAGEFGHQTIDMHGPPDGSGNAGGWEGYASGPAIGAMAAKAVMQGMTTLIREMVNGDLNAINPEVVRRAAESGDALAQDILERAGFYLGTGIANVLTILSPHCVIIGGGLTALGEWIMRPIRETLARRCHTVPLEQVVFSAPVLGEAAGMLGAALWAQAQDANR